jgi:hypothetical protein
MSDRAMHDLRQMHRAGTADFSTALAYARASYDLNWEALLALSRGLGEDDDLLGVVIWLAQVVGRALRDRDSTAVEILDRLADVEAAKAAGSR